MTRVLYVTEGRYVIWYSRGHDCFPTEIYEESNYYKHYQQMPIEEYLIKFCIGDNDYGFQNGTKEFNKFKPTQAFTRSEFEIIYDDTTT
jgi:hypothetical protein